MYGMLVWTEDGKRGLERREILRLPFLCAVVRRRPRMPEGLIRRRVVRAAKALHKQGAGRIVTPEDFASVMAQCAQNGASLLGGCCGTDPGYIAAIQGI